MKRLIKILIASIFTLVLLILLLPIFFKSEITELIKKEINNNIHAKVDFQDVDISFIRSFPKVNLQLLLFTIDGIEEFENQRLLEADVIDFSIDFKSLISPKKGIRIHDFNIEKASLNLIGNEAGKFNYEILPEQDTSVGESIYFGSIDQYSLNNCDVLYYDPISLLDVTVKGIDHHGKGDFSNSVFDLETQTTFDSLDITYARIPYLHKVKGSSDMIIQADLNKNLYTFKENSTMLNQLPLTIEGDFTLFDDHYLMNLNCHSTDNNIASFLSIVPGLFVQDYSSIKSEGTASVDFNLNGIYNSDKNILPEMKLKIELTEGYIQYPELSFPVKNINSKLDIKALEGNWEDMLIDLSQLNFIINDRPFGAQLKVSNVFANSHYKAAMTGSLDLADVSKAIDLQEFGKLTGIVEGNFKLDANQFDIINKNYNAIQLDGLLGANVISLVNNDYNFTMSEANAQFNPQNISATFKDMKFNGSDFSGELQIKDPLLFLLNNKLNNLSIRAHSNYINLDQIQSSGSGKGQVTTNEKTIQKKELTVLEKAKLEYTIKKLSYENKIVENIVLDGNWQNDSLVVNKMALDYEGSSMQMTGYISHLQSYFFENDTLKGKLYWKANTLDVGKFAQSDQNTSSTSTILVPYNIDIELNADIGSLVYDNLEFKNFTGKLLVADQTIVLLNTQAGFLNGRVAFEGSYSTVSKEEPLFDFKYDMSQISYQKLFESSNLFKKLNPLAEYLDGNFNSTFVISGPLGQDMFPVLNRIDASGFLETLQTEISGLPIVSAIKSKLGFEAAKKWYLEDSRNWFVVKDGKVIIQDFSKKLDDISYDFSGTYALDHTIDFKIKTAIPREKLENNSVTQKLSLGIEEISKQAKALGINVELGPNIFFDISLGGSFKKPTLKITPTGSGGENMETIMEDRIKLEADKLKDTLSSKIKEKTTQVEDSIRNAGTAVVDSIKRNANNKIEQAENKIKDAAQSKIDSTLSKMGIDSTSVIKDKVGDLIKNSDKSDIDSIKSKLNEWNPFKKKKKNE